MGEYADLVSTPSAGEYDQDLPFGRNQVLENLMISLKADSPLHVSVEFKYSIGSQTIYVGLFDGWISGGQDGSYQGVIAGGFIGPSEYNANLRVKVTNDTDGAIEWHIFYRYSEYRGQPIQPYVSGLQDSAIFYYKGTCTQSADADAAIGIHITPGAGNQIELLYFRLVVADNTGAKTYSIIYADETTPIKTIAEASLDDSAIEGPSNGVSLSTVTATTAANIAAVFQNVITGAIRVRIKGASLANTDNFTLRAIFRVTKNMPDVAPYGTNVALTNETEVIL